ncbi:S9 family peptidase [Ammoniphilus sp. CFH 90114]|uniref:alpha/beta hydrolase family protein n=1 Tax=Ammoniphilus sp. CFH 90114 TaxID=2493665 RepID=UPI0013E939FC|nr:alpha/beta fold hydrolase [Ammoniphilus sp. CFH 90114]
MLKFTEEEVKFTTRVDVYGTLTIPDNSIEKLPAVILVSGSGPIDRDGTVSHGKFKTDLYKDIAHLITQEGFITLRYDKRGTGKSGGEWLKTGMWDLVEDLEGAYRFIQEHPRVDNGKIVLAGHSEGTIIVTAVVERHSEIAGMMLLSGGVDNLDEALVHQRKLSYNELRNKKGISGWIFRKVINGTKQEEKVKKQMKPILESTQDIVKVQLFIKQPAKWYREHFSYNTREALKNISCPVFAIQGDKDPLVENEVLKELPDLVQGACEFHIIPNMEHALKEQTEPRTILNYKKVIKSTIGKPIHPIAQEKILNWLKAYI